jgi:sugar phosphate isomerase/epimerase
MKISCSWLYATSKYGTPPSLADTQRALKDMAALGFSAVEMEGVGEEQVRAVHAARNDLKTLGDELGLRIVAFRPVLPELVHGDKTRRVQALDLFKLAVETATAFGADTIQTAGYPPPAIDPAFRWDDLWGRLVDSLGACADEAARADLTFCVEPRAGDIISTTDGLLRLMDAVDMDNFGAALDTGQQHGQKEMLPLSVEKLGARLLALHASDSDGHSAEPLAVGRGSVDWEGIFAALKKHGFAGHVAVTVGQGPDLDARVRESKAYLEKLAARLEL